MEKSHNLSVSVEHTMFFVKKNLYTLVSPQKCAKVTQCLQATIKFDQTKLAKHVKIKAIKK